MDLISVYGSVVNYLKRSVLEVVLRDHDLISSGYKIYFAVDHHEVSRYCYPLDPAKRYSDSQITEIIKQQNAYYDLFYRLSTKPVLLLPYVEELFGLIEYLKSSTDAYSESELSRFLFRELELEDDQVQLARQSLDLTVDELGHSHDRTLTYLLACNSIGPRRLESLYRTRLEKDRMPWGARKLIDFSKFAPGTTYFLVRDILSRRPGNELSSHRDALAIDAIFQANEVLIPNKRLLLYVSSTRTSDALFRSRILAARFPIVEGRAMNILRNHDHFWTHMVFRESKTSQALAAKKTASNIRLALDIISSAQSVILSQKDKAKDSACRGCTFDSGCEHIETCKNLRDLGVRISARKELYGEWGGLKGLRDLSDYLASNRTKFRNSRQATFVLKFIRNHISQWEATMNVDLSKTVRNAIVNSSIARNIGDLSRRIPISMSDDRVTCRLQHLPVFLNLREPSARAINEKFQYCILNDEEWDSVRFELVNEAFMRIADRALADQMSPEEQLLTGALYTVWTDEDGLHSARNIAYLLYNANDIDPFVQQEALYLLVWVNRLLKYLDQSIELARIGIRDFPDDPRFHHGMQLGLHLICRQKGTFSPAEIKEIVGHGDRAIQLYIAHGQKEGQIVCINNNAYILAARSRSKADFYSARKYLDNLCESFPEESWGRRYPEFFDTKATVHFRLAESLMEEESATPEYARAASYAEARIAETAIDAALDIVQKPRYLARKERIDQFLHGSSVR